MISIHAITPQSPAADVGLQVGDVLLKLNGEKAEDFLDLHLAEQAGVQTAEVRRTDGQHWLLDLHLPAGEPLGALAEPPLPMTCGNRCLFCFVHQLPKGLRPSLYLKDEDYRFSYLYGSYITLSNMTEADYRRIIEKKLSPLYLSVHATDPMVRNRLLGNEQPPILPQLQRLLDGGIDLHTQVVVCPGLNDGAVLDQTIEQLHRLGTGVQSLALVAVGLTDHRHGLPPLRTFTRDESRQLVEQAERWQQRFLAEQGRRFVWPVDEFYLKAGLPLPGIETYEEMPQYENGVGMLAHFNEEARQVLNEAPALEAATFSVVTGESAQPYIEPFCQKLSAVTGVDLQVFVIKNHFFGAQVSVAGLLTGQDIKEQLVQKRLGDQLFLPDVLLRPGEEVFLDDMTVEDLQDALQVGVTVFDSTPEGLLYGIEDYFDPSIEIVCPASERPPQE